MKSKSLLFFPLLAVLLFSSCKREVLTDELRDKLLDKTWRVQFFSLEVEGDTTFEFQYSGSVGLLTVKGLQNGTIVMTDTLWNLYEEWEFDDIKSRAGREELGQAILPFFSDTICRPLLTDDDYLFASWLPLEGNDPGQFMSFSLHLPVLYVADNVPWNHESFLLLRGETTWEGDSVLFLDQINGDPEEPNSPYTFQIRIDEVQESKCQNPAFCDPWLEECVNGTYSWRACQCDCEEGWKGSSCEVFICEDPPACVNGTAIPQGQLCQCECEEGWTGSLCDEPIPTGLDCDTSTIPCYQGVRVASEDSMNCECQCYPGWEGADCSQTKMKTVSTVAGSGSTGFSNGSGAAASFHEPRGMITDAQGNIYVADAANNVIRKVTPSGDVSTFAGTGVAGYLDGPADSAMFHNPSDIARDPQGNFYVTDHFNHVIRKITPDGTVSTIAGTGSPGTTNGDLLLSSFSNPFSIVWDEYFLLGNQVLLVSDRGSNIIRKIDLEAETVSNFAGQFNPIGGNINGPASNAAFSQITGMSLSSEGALYVADWGNDAVRKITITNGQADQVWTYVGRQPNGNVIGMAANDPLNKPADVLWQFPDLIFVTDSDNHRIRVIVDSGLGFGSTRDAAGSPQNVAGFVNGMGTDARFDQPFGLCMDYDNVIYVSESGNSSIRKLE